MSACFTVTSEAVLSRVVDRLTANWREQSKRGRALVVTIEHADEPRTMRQLRRYWKLLRFIAEHYKLDGKSFEAEWWDEYYRRELIGCEEINGEIVALSASEHSIGDFNDLMRGIEAHAVGELHLELEHMA